MGNTGKYLFDLGSVQRLNGEHLITSYRLTLKPLLNSMRQREILQCLFNNILHEVTMFF